MKFIKLNSSTVRCFLSKEDLEAHGVQLTDFIEHNQSAKELIDYLMHKSMQELGYERKGEMITINVMPMPEDAIVLTFSDDSEELREIVRHLIEVAKSLNLDADEGDKEIKNAIIDEAVQKISGRLMRGSYSTEFDSFAFKFASLKDAINYAKAVSFRMGRMLALSSLYRRPNSDEYYITFERGAMDSVRFNYLGVCAMEFGSIISVHELSTARIREHNTQVIEDDAIEKLQKL